MLDQSGPRQPPKRKFQRTGDVAAERARITSTATPPAQDQKLHGTSQPTNARPIVRPAVAITDRQTGLDIETLGHEAMPVLQAIRAKCLDCSGGDRSEVADCLVRNCALWPFRMAKNPWKPAPSEAQRAASLKALAKAKSSPSLGTSGATVKRAGSTGHDTRTRAKNGTGLKVAS